MHQSCSHQISTVQGVAQFKIPSGEQSEDGA